MAAAANPCGSIHNFDKLMQEALLWRLSRSCVNSRSKKPCGQFGRRLLMQTVSWDDSRVDFKTNFCLESPQFSAIVTNNHSSFYSRRETSEPCKDRPVSNVGTLRGGHGRKAHLRPVEYHSSQPIASKTSWFAPPQDPDVLPQLKSVIDRIDEELPEDRQMVGSCLPSFRLSVFSMFKLLNGTQAKKRPQGVITLKQRSHPNTPRRHWKTQQK